MTDQKNGLSKTQTIVIIVVVVIGLGAFSVIAIGILAAIALPNFIGAQAKAQDASVTANMRTAQIAAESYATDTGGKYPIDVSAGYKSYFPGGASDGKKAATSGPINPFDSEHEWPKLGTTITNVQEFRSKSPEEQKLSKGEVEYTVIYNEHHEPTSYAIRGGSHLGYAIHGTADGTTLVLSNQ